MKICHFADSHLGAGENRTSRAPSGLTLRQEDIVNSFIESIDKIIAIKPDVVIHAGDIFDKVRPSNRIIAIASEHLNRLSNVNNIPTIIIAGNHDAPKQPHYGAALDIFKQIRNLHVASKSRLEVFKIINVSFFALPHCLNTDILKEELSKCRPDKNSRYNILILHGVAAGMPEFSMADLGEQELPLDRMALFDYTALGHYHNYSQVGKRAWYSGSSERLSQAERETPKGFIELDLEPFKLKFHEVNTRQMVDLQIGSVKGKRGDEVMEIIRRKLEKIDSSDKIIRVVVKDVSPETVLTIPANSLNELRQKSFSLDIKFEKEKTDEVSGKVGRTAIGKIDTKFFEFLLTKDLKESEIERLKNEAIKYLSDES